MSTASNEPPLGSSQSYGVVVRPADLASEIASDVNSDRFPRVLATSRLIAFMEIAAARVLQPHLGPGQLSVGTRIDVTHTAPTPVGSEVTTEAKFIGKKDKLFVFEVLARDEAGEVGRGTHERAIVDIARLENGAQKRLQAPAT
ncbi:thioesterase family protein [Aspergillus lucknowensis]|uniref:HotDog domain-containing protein n=1 Tax=Aspergillus lucknowensis TaxID=176173 RepID=A0ABR4LXH5_9EURO